jgi:hypothetical protein
VINTTERAVESGVRRLCRLLDMDPRQLEQKGSAWQKWLNKWGAEVLDHGPGDERLLLKISAVVDRFRSSDAPLLDEIVSEALAACTDSGGSFGDFMDGKIRWTDRQDRTHTVPVSRVLEPTGDPKRGRAPPG